MPLQKQDIPRNTLFILFLIFITLSSCKGGSGVQVYRNSETGIRINKPDNWKVSFNERNGLIAITAKEGFWKHDSARIEIFAGTCPISPATSDSFSTPLNELLQQDIERIGKLYNQESVSIQQEPIKISYLISRRWLVSIN